VHLPLRARARQVASLRRSALRLTTACATSVITTIALPNILANVIDAIVLAGLYIGYLSFMESSSGKTLGKMLLKLEVRGPQGGPPTMEQAVKRNAYFGLALLGAIPFVGWLLQFIAMVAAIIYILVTINNSPTNQGWHDVFASGTWVVKSA